MKKIVISLALALVLCFSLFLISCGDTHTGCTHEYDNTNCDTKCNLCGKPYHNGHEMVTPSIEGCQVPSYCTRCDYQTCEELIIEHLFVDENGNTLEKCARCNALNPDAPEQKPEPDGINTTYFQYTYDYGWHILGKLTLLCDGGHFNSSFGTIERPKDIVAGDIIKLVHTGEIWTEESYPSSHGLYNGNLISYSFEYAPVIHLMGEAYSIEFIKNSYDLDEEYVILDRVGNFVPLDEYNGDEIYLVIDQKRLPDYGWNGDFSDLDVEQPNKIIPIASMFAYNPRDLEDGAPLKTVAELRNEKVSFDLDYHEIGDMLEKEETEADSTKHQFGYLGTNESGNKYIIYAPNIYSYYVSIKCTDDFSGVESVIRKIEYDYFDRSHIGGNDETHIDTVELFDNEILITFPDFDSYALCQEELLNKLSALDSVLKISVSYINAQDGTKQVNNPYEYINLGNYWKLEEQNRIFRTYEEFSQAFADISTDALDEITAQTFESYYVFMVICTYSGDTHGFDISDAKVDGNRVLFTTNKYVKSGLHDMWLATDYCIVLVPKEELGELPNEISSVIDMQIAVYVDRYEPATIDMGDAISIAFSHFYSNYNFTPVANHTYIAEAIDGVYIDDYWYIWIHPVYIGNEGDGPLWDGECITYTIDKTNGGIINIEVDE